MSRQCLFSWSAVSHVVVLMSIGFVPRPALADENPEQASAGFALQVDQLFQKWDRPDVPGAAVGIIHEGKLIYKKGFGAANVESPAPITPQTIFETASFSKSITCACLALLLDQGKISPEDDLRKHLPQMHAFDPPVRIKHMIRCRSGLWAQFHIMPLAGWDNVPVHSPFSRDDLLAVLTGQKRLPFPPGTQFQYGSGEYFLLGEIVRRVSGKSLAEFARENIFEPLGMTRTFYEEDPSLVVKDRATGHYKERDGKLRQWKNHSYLAGGGGFNTCIVDLHRWDNNFENNQLPEGKYLREFLQEGTLLNNRHVVDLDAYRKEVAREIPNPPAGQYRGLKRIMFTGGVWGMSAAMARFPQQRFTVVCLSNNEEVSPWKKAMEIADLYLADQLEPIPGDKSKEDKPAFIELPTGELQKRTGAYRMKATKFIWTLTMIDGELTLTDHLRKSIVLKPISPTEFRPTGDHWFYDSARFVFSENSSQEPDSLTLTSNEKGFRELLPFEKVELVQPTLEVLRKYVGEFHSDELAVVYRFKVQDDALWLRVGPRRWERLEPTVRDEFVAHRRTSHDNRIIAFHRKATQNVQAESNNPEEATGFTISFWRIRGVEFTKIERRE